MLLLLMSGALAACAPRSQPTPLVIQPTPTTPPSATPLASPTPVPLPTLAATPTPLFAVPPTTAPAPAATVVGAAPAAPVTAAPATPTAAPATPTSAIPALVPTAPPSPTAPAVVATGRLGDLPIMMPIGAPTIAAYFNQIARPTDIALVPAQGVSRLLSQIVAGQRCALFTSWAQAQSQVGAYNGVNIIGYDPEHWAQTPANEQANLPGTVQQAEVYAHSRGQKLLVAPDQRFDAQYLSQIAAHADYLVLQGQHQEANPSAFASWIGTSARTAKAANPQIQVFAQVVAGLDPASSEIASLNTVAGDIDGIALWTNVRTLPDTQQIVNQIR
jgi:hypothetical protein